MSVEQRNRPRFATSRALLAIADHHCPCCDGLLATSDWPSWRRCQECLCLWRETVIQGCRYACRVRGRCRPEEDR